MKWSRSSVYHLGVDLGSVSLKVALLRGSDVLYQQWARVTGNPIAVLADVLEPVCALHPEVSISGIAVTGSGRGLISSLFNAQEVNEISAHARATAELYPQVRSIIEIGGQDSKFIVLGDDHEVQHFAMNEVCAAGTGAFLDQQAARLGLSIHEFSVLALKATSPARIAGRCAVFARTDMTHHQQEGCPLPDIIAGLNEALVRSYLANLVRGRTIPTPVALEGGTARNEGLVAAFRRVLQWSCNEYLVPPHHGVMGAIGAALLAGDAEPRRISDIVSRLRRHECPSKSHTTGLPRLHPPSLRPMSFDASSLNLDGTYVGVDVGSVSIKLVALSPAGVVYSDYRFSNGQPLEVLRVMYSSMRERLGEFTIAGAGVTGSGRNFLGAVLEADVVENEITAQARAAACLAPGVDTVIEIGGQDSKFLRLQGCRTTHFAMNRVCAAGTGAFIQEQAVRIGLAIENTFSAAAFESESPATLGARCTVFMESDLVAYQQQGGKRSDLAAGLAYSLAENYLDKVVAGQKLGKRILFLGGVAENPAVVAAMASRLSQEVLTSSVGRVSGAIGAALAASEAKRQGRYESSRFSIRRLSGKLEKFVCLHCPNACRINRLPALEPKHFGGRCGRWDGGVSMHRSVSSGVEQRLHLLEEMSRSCDSNLRRSGIRVGIPRALMAYDRLPLWRSFFEAMGVEVVLSPQTNRTMLANGVERQVAETCLPVKAFVAHLRWLEDHGRCDFVFVPSLVSTGVDAHGKETVHCPFVQSAAQFARPATGLQLLNPVISSLWHPDDEHRAMVAAAEQIGIDRSIAERAWSQATETQKQFREHLRELGRQTLANVAAGRRKRVFVLLGKDYNVCDPLLNSQIVQIFAARGEFVITQDMLAADSGAYSIAYRSMYWSHSKEILSAAEIIASTPGLFAVMITSFGCGPDSFTTRLVTDAMGDKPMLFLEVDEHSSNVGMETRIEAFLDGLSETKLVRCVSAPSIITRPQGIKRVYIPNFSDHSLAFAAAVDAMGLEPVLTEPPGDQTALAGVKHCNAGECHPFSLLLGGYIRAAEAERGSTDACYLIPESNLCRLGQFGTQMRIVAREQGLALPVYTRFEDVARVGRAGLIRAGLRYWQVLRSMDFLLQKLIDTRARESMPGATDRTYATARAPLFNAVLRGEVHNGLRDVLRALESVPIDTGRRVVKIGITGDYYTRICNYANSEIFRHIERMGGTVLLPSTLSELVIYGANQKLAAARERKSLSNTAFFWITRKALTEAERSIREVFGSSLSYDVPLDCESGMRLAAPYVDARMPSGITGSVATILEQIRAGADGILNLITLHCSYGLVLNAMLASMDGDFPAIPKLTLIFEGLKPTHILTRLEAFMDRVWNCERVCR